VSEAKKAAQAAAAAAPLPSNAPKGMAELKVTAHLMSFDAGIYCIFNPPGSPVPDPATGLPGVRVSLPPGPAFHPEAVTISTFRDDGWLGGWNGAALVRVARGPAQLLVTIYQLPNHTGEAPKLQILRLTEGVAPPAPGGRPAAPAQVAAPAQPAAAPAAIPQNTPAGAAGGTASDAASAEIVAHVQTRGDVIAPLGDWMGVKGSKHWIEGFALSPKNVVGPEDIEYQAVLGRGWLSPWAEGGQFCGSRGMSLPILGLRVRLRGEAADAYDCEVTASFVDGTEIGPLDNGEPAQAESLAPLEAFRIVLKPRGAVKKPAPKAEKAAAKPAAAPAKPAAKAPPAPAKPAPKAPAKRK
jgi:hypothetical protein